MNSHYPTLFSPLDLGTVTIPNRLAMAPMSTSLGGADGQVTPASIAFYRERALGGFGLIIVEFTCVDPASGKTEHYQLSLEDRRNLDSHARLVEAIHGAGSKAFVQLQHGGRFALPHLLPGKMPKNPSRVTSRKDPNKIIAEAFTHDEILHLIEAFGRSARLSIEAGYDGIEVHGAHGYLVAQFLSGMSNHRDDEWGGDEERRMAFPLAVVRAIRAEIGDKPLVFRISADEFHPEGITIDDTCRMMPKFVEAGMSIVHASTGRGPDTFEKVMEPISTPEGWRIPYARRLRDASGVPVITVGQIRWPEMAEKAITDGSADMVALGRPSLADPEWPNKAREGRLKDIRPCTSCNWCISGATERVTCAENPRCGHELDAMLPDNLGNGKRAVVVGAGPGGMSAALMLDQAGFETHLYESRNEVGGGLFASGNPPGKDKFFWYRDYLSNQLSKGKVQLHLGSHATADDLISLKPDVAFIATGTQSKPMPIEGATPDMVLDSFDVLMGDLDPGVEKGATVVVYGGGETGCETADYFADLGINVVLVTRSGAHQLARAAEFVYRRGLLKQITTNPLIELVTDSHILRVSPGEVTIGTKDGTERVITADKLLVAQGREPQNAIADQLMAAGIKCHVVGDSRKVGRIGSAVHASYDATRAVLAHSSELQKLSC